MRYRDWTDLLDVFDRCGILEGIHAISLDGKKYLKYLFYTIRMNVLKASPHISYKKLKTHLQTNVFMNGKQT